MASKPFLDIRRRTWYCSHKSPRTGRWTKVALCKETREFSPSRPPKKPPQQAIDLAAELSEVERRDRLGILASPDAARGLAGYVERFIEGYAATRAEGSVKQVRRAARSFVDWCAERGIKAIREVSRATCRDYLEWRAGAGVAIQTLHSEKGYIAPIFTRAVEDEIIPANPWQGVRPPGKRADHVPTFWSSGQIAALAEAMPNPLYRDMVLVMANSGIRVSAALAMEWPWIDWEAGLIRVPKEQDKAKKGYRVPLTSTSRDVLQRRLVEGSGAGCVFPSPRTGRAMNYSSFRDALVAAIGRAGVPVGSPHDLRHSFARLLVASGMPVNEVQAALGHSTLAMTMKYVKVDGDRSVARMEGMKIGEAG